MHKIKEVIVVEGRDDTIAIQQAVEADTIETGGSALNQEKLERIRLAKERRGVIIFTDPDYPGEKLRKTISQAIPGCKHAFLPQEKARSKQGKYGVEHATREDIRIALASVYTELETTEQLIAWQDLCALGLIGGTKSRALRERICTLLGIGYGNAKQMHKRLHLFRIGREEFIQAYERAVQEGQKE